MRLLSCVPDSAPGNRWASSPAGWNRVSQRRRERPRRARRTLTVLTLKLSPRLRFIATTKTAESLVSRTRLVQRNVKRWRSGQMMLRWVAAGILEAVKGFRRLKGILTCPRWSTGCVPAIANWVFSKQRRIVRSRSRQLSRR